MAERKIANVFVLHLTTDVKCSIITIEREVRKMARQTDITKCRIEFLKQFDYYVRNIIGDDDITVNIWLAGGVPDGYTEEDLKEIALDDELWLDCVNCFAECCKVAGVI